MPKKKKVAVSLEFVELNPTWDYRKTRIFNNYICNRDDAEKLMPEMDVKELWKHEKNYSNELKAILAPHGTRNSSEVFFGNDVSVEEVKLPDSVKPSTKYVYKIYDYFGGKLNVEYGTQKDAVSYITKKIKTKYVYVAYNGTSDRVEYSPKDIVDILNELEPTTSQFEIEPASRSGDSNDIIMVSIFKNCIK